MTANPQAGGQLGAPSRRPAAPAGLGTEGLRTWRNLAAAYEFSAAELLLVAELCRTADLLARLRAEQEGAPLTVVSRVHGQVQSPLLPALAVAQAELRRLHAALGFPAAAGDVQSARPVGRRDPRSHRRAG